MNEAKLKEKIRKKVKNTSKSFFYKAKGVHSESNIETYVVDTTKAMLKIIKTEVNIRLQEIKHGK